MKHFYLLLIGLFIGSSSYSQSYYLSIDSIAYNDLTNSILLSDSIIYWDEVEMPIALPFNFQIFGNSYDSLMVYSNGDVYFGAGPNFMSESDTVIMISAFGFYYQGSDLMDRGYMIFDPSSPISYKVTGSTGNHVLHVEWKNAGFYEEYQKNGTMNDFINVQLRLFEGSNDFEVHIGPNSVQAGSYYDATGPTIGAAFIEFYNITLWNNNLLSGNPANPVLTNNFVSLPSTPAPNTVYRFSTQQSTGATNLLNGQQFVVYPNPASSKLIIRNASEDKVKFRLEVYNVLGNRSIEKEFYGNETSLNLEYLTPGIYFLRITEGNELKQQVRFIKN